LKLITDKYSKSKHQWHLAILGCLARFVVAVAGRRTGKSYTCSLLFLKRFFNLLSQQQALVQAGLAPKWSGFRLSRRRAIRCTHDAIKVLVVAPSQKHLDEIRGYVENHLRKSGAVKFLHPDPIMAYHDRPRMHWFLYGQTAGVISYMVATHTAQLRGSGYQLIWLDEAGEIDNTAWQALRPTIWESKASVIISGTPSVSEEHWLTELAISGLPITHERAKPDSVKPNPEVVTFLGRSDKDAYLDSVREESAKEVELYGATSIYVLSEILGDWRLPSLSVFPWNAGEHYCTLSESHGEWRLRYKGKEYQLGYPRILGGIDWFRNWAPGGCVVVARWPRNPLIADDTRGLSIVLDCAEWVRAGYHDDKAEQDLKRLQQRWNVARWYQDPYSPQLTSRMRKAGINIVDTDASEKKSRIGLLQRQLSFTDAIRPSMLVSHAARRVAEQIERYRYSTTRQGKPTDKFVQYDDCFVDCLAYIAPHLGSVGLSVVGGGF
jgi:hypothetical protein